MPSMIDETMPVAGTPTTASVRANFATAKTEITALQAATAGSPFLPLAGGQMTGPMYLDRDPTSSMMPATKGYVDAGGTGGGGGGIPEAPADGGLYGRGDGAWHPVQPLIGGGDLTLGGNLHLGNYVYFAGATGAVNGIGGPLIFGDANYIILQCGTGNSGIVFANHSGVGKHTFDAVGNYTASGNIAGVNVTGSGNLSITGSSTLGNNVAITGSIRSTGAGSALYLADRTTSRNWAWYAGGDRMRLFNGTADIATVDPSGNATLAGPYLFLNNATGSVNTAGGPLFYADTANMVLKVGQSNGGWLFQNYAGTTVALLTNAGQFQPNSINTPSISTSSISCVGAIQASGPSGSLAFIDRSSGRGWSWFGNGDAARLNSSGFGDVLIIDATGNTGVTGTLQVSGGGAAALNVPNGGAAIAGTLAVNQTLTVSGGGNAVISVPNGGITLYEATLTSGGDQVVNCPNGGITVQGVNSAQVNCSGNAYKPGGGPWSDSSDIRLKRDVEDYRVGLHAICQLRPRSYEFNGLAATKPGTRHIGLIADEVEKIMPEMVGSHRKRLHPSDEFEVDVKTLDTTALVFALVNALKEVQGRLTLLESRP